MNDEVFADPADIAQEQAQRAKAHRAIEQADIAEIMQSAAVRRVLRRLIFDRCGVLRHTFNADARVDALKQGERNVGLWMAAQLSAVEPKALSVLMQEPEHTEKPA